MDDQYSNSLKSGFHDSRIRNNLNFSPRFSTSELTREEFARQSFTKSHSRRNSPMYSPLLRSTKFDEEIMQALSPDRLVATSPFRTGDSTNLINSRKQSDNKSFANTSNLVGVELLGSRSPSEVKNSQAYVEAMKALQVKARNLEIDLQEKELKDEQIINSLHAKARDLEMDLQQRELKDEQIINRLEQRIHELEKTQSIYKSELESKQHVFQELEQKLKDQLRFVERELIQKNLLVQSLQRELEQYNSHVMNEESQTVLKIRKLEIEMDMKKEKEQKMADIHNLLNDQIRELEVKNHQCESEREMNERAFKQRFQKYQREIEVLKQRLSDFNQESNDIKVQMEAEFQFQLEELNKQLEYTQQQKNSCANELNQISIRNESLFQENSNLLKKVFQLESELNARRQAEISQEKRIAKLQVLSQAARELNKKLMENILESKKASLTPDKNQRGSANQLGTNISTQKLTNHLNTTAQTNQKSKLKDDQKNSIPTVADLQEEVRQIEELSNALNQSNSQVNQNPMNSGNNNNNGQNIILNNNNNQGMLNNNNNFIPPSPFNQNNQSNISIPTQTTFENFHQPNNNQNKQNFEPTRAQNQFNFQRHNSIPNINTNHFLSPTQSQNSFIGAASVRNAHTDNQSQNFISGNVGGFPNTNNNIQNPNNFNNLGNNNNNGQNSNYDQTIEQRQIGEIQTGVSSLNNAKSVLNEQVLQFQNVVYQIIEIEKEMGELNIVYQRLREELANSNDSEKAPFIKRKLMDVDQKINQKSDQLISLRNLENSMLRGEFNQN